MVFCSTVAHAEHVTEAFRAAGVSAALIHGDLAAETRKAILADYAAGGIRVVVNVAVLTEGWDHPPTSCVVLLRPSSYKSTMIQMVGRGLRTVDPEEHPGIVKTDCIVLDFGTSSLTHGTLEQDVDLDGRIPTPGEAPTKICPECKAEIPIAVTECPICGCELPREGAEPIDSFVMTELDLLERSSSRGWISWRRRRADGQRLSCLGRRVLPRWPVARGRRATGRATRLLGVGEQLVYLAQADDWLNEHETDESAFKSKGWLKQDATEKQLKYLPPEFRRDYGLSRYRASPRAIPSSCRGISGSRTATSPPTTRPSGAARSAERRKEGPDDTTPIRGLRAHAGPSAR